MSRNLNSCAMMLHTNKNCSMIQLTTISHLPTLQVKSIQPLCGNISKKQAKIGLRKPMKNPSTILYKTNKQMNK